MIVLLAILLGLVICLPAPSRAADVPAEPLRIGALPPPMVTGKTPVLLADNSDIRTQEDPSEDDLQDAIVLTPQEYKRLKQPGHSLSPREYKEFKNLIEISKATPLQVAAVNTAVKGTSLLVLGIAWLAFLSMLRWQWKRSFTEATFQGKWGVAVIVAVVVCTAWVLTSVVS